MTGIIMCHVLLLACLLCVLWPDAAVADKPRKEENANVSGMADDATAVLELAKEVKVETKNNSCTGCTTLAAKAMKVATAAKTVMKTSQKAVTAYKDATMARSAHNAALLAAAAQAVFGNAMTVERTVKRIMAIPRAVKHLKKAEKASADAKSNAAQLEQQATDAIKNIGSNKPSESETEEVETVAEELGVQTALTKMSAEKAISVLKVDRMGAAVNKADELENAMDEVVDQTEKMRNALQAKNLKDEERKKALKDALQRLKELAAGLQTMASCVKEALKEARDEAKSLSTEGPQRAIMQATKLVEEVTLMEKSAEKLKKAEVDDKADIAAALKKPPPRDETKLEEETVGTNDSSPSTPSQFVAFILLPFLLACVAAA